ncbi:MAG: benzoate-CoA ligase family protein [Candidatus Limnocylindria bacterium]
MPVTAFNLASALADAACAAGRARAPAVRFAGETMSYGDLAALQDAAALALRDRGVRRGERVALVLRDSPDFIAAFLGAVKIGAIPVPLSTLARPDELAFMQGDCGAVLTVTDADTAQLAGRPGPVEAAPTGGDDMCFWQYSSGTTGAPKAVIHLQRRALFPAEAHGRHIARIGPADRVYSTAKLFFSYGLNNSMVVPLAAGASVVLDPERFAPDRAWQLIAVERPTVLYSVPTAYAALLAAAETGTPADPSSLRLCISAGEALPAPLLARWEARFGLRILDGIGSTEIGYIAISNSVEDVTPGSSGRVIPGYDARVVDPDGADAEEGTLWVRGGSTALGYHDRPAATAAAFRDGWVVTGDRYRVADGRYRHLGRDDDMLRVGAQWVSPLEVEAILLRHPDVGECAVVGRADRDGLIKACAYVVPKAAGRSLPTELVALCGAALPGHKRPRWIELVPELPKTATGKIQRYRLRDGGRSGAAVSVTGRSGA